MLKVDWNKLVEACETLDKHGYRLPLKTKAIATRKYVLDNLKAGKRTEAHRAFRTFKKSAPMEVEDGEDDDAPQTWNPQFSVTFADCMPNEWDSDEDWEYWRHQMCAAMFNDEVFNCTQHIDKVENHKFLCRFAEEVVTEMRKGYGDADPASQEYVIPLINFCLFCIAVLNPCPKAFGSAAEHVWYCVTQPQTDPAKKRRKTCQLSQLVKEAANLCNEIRINETWTEMLLEFSEFAPTQERYGQELCDLASSLQVTYDSLVDGTQNIEEEAVAFPMAADLTKFKQNAKWWKDNFRQGACECLFALVGRLLNLQFEHLHKTKAEKHKFEALKKMATLCANQDVAAKVRRQMLEMASSLQHEYLKTVAEKDLADKQHTNDLLETLRKNEHVPKTDEGVEVMKGIYGRIPTTLSSIHMKATVTKQELQALLDVWELVISDKDYQQRSIREGSQLKDEFEKFKKAVNTVADLRSAVQNLSKKSEEAGVATLKPELHKLLEQIGAFDKLKKTPPKFEAGNVSAAAEGIIETCSVLCDGNDSHPGVRELLSRNIGQYQSSMLERLAQGDQTLGDSAGGGKGGGGKIWSDGLEEAPTQEKLKEFWNESLSHVDAKVDEGLTNLKKDTGSVSIGDHPLSVMISRHHY